jgi:2-succinyl-6-hydroxy-2,4-cyclohexadiene-1-carboxylate synthase
MVARCWEMLAPRWLADGWMAASAPLLVAVHGWLLAGRLWDPLVQHLQPRRDLWCPDLPGFGRCLRPRGLQPSLASYGRWLAEAARRQAQGRPVVLIGHSLGGSICLHAAPLLGDQLQGLVQIAVGGGIYQPRPFALVRRGGATFLRWRPGWLAGLPAAEALASPLRAELHAARGLLACSMRRSAVGQLPALVSRLAVPSLWIAGRNDRVMEPRYVQHLAGYAPHHQLAVLPAAGHLPMRQMPLALAAVIEPWLDQRLASPRS